LTHTTLEVFFIYSADRSQLLYISPAYESLWGRSSDSLYYNPAAWQEAVHPEDQEQLSLALEQQSPEIPFTHEYRIIQPNGAVRWISARSSPIYNRAGTLERIVVFAEDITERKRSEQQLHRLNRSLRTTSECNQALVRATDEAALLQEICQILVEFGGYRAAWIGFAEPGERKQVRPVAQAGLVNESLQNCQFSGADHEWGSDPTGSAIRTGQVQVVQDILHESNFAPWRETALHDGYAAAIALPLSHQGMPFGALNLYSADAHAFTSAEVKLLTELANDLAYGISALRTHSALHDSETKFRIFLEAASEAVIVSQSNGEITLFNSKAEEIFGYRQAEVLGRLVECLMPERFRQGHRRFRDSYYTQPSQRSMGQTRNLYALRKDGTEFPIEAGLSSVQIGDEQFVLTFLTDITDRKQVEENLRDSEARFRNMADDAPVMIWVADATGYCTFLSQSWYDFTGQTEETGLGSGWLNAVHPDDRALTETLFIEAHERQENFRIEYRLWHKDGEYRWALDTATPRLSRDGQFNGYIGSVLDISDRKQAEQALQESEARLKLAYQATRSGLWDWNIYQNRAHVSEEYCDLFGLPPNTQTISYEQWLSLVHPDDRAAASAAVSRPIEQRQAYYEDEYRVLHPDGIRWLAGRGQVFYDAAGKPIRMLGNMQDITERKQAEIALSQLNEELEQRVADRTAELSQLNERLQQELLERERAQQRLQEQAQLLDLAHDTIMTCDLNGVITFWNQGAERMYGWTRDEAIGKVSHDMLRTQFPIPFTQILTELKRCNYWEGELIHTSRSGNPITVASRWVLQRDRNGSPIKILEINNDITERKRAEEIHQRLAAIVESSDDGIVSTTLDGVIVSWNPGAAKIYGYPASEIIGQRVQKLLPPDRLHEATQIIEHIQNGKRMEHYETVRLHKDGKLIHVSLTVSPIRNAAGQVIGISKIARDITARMQAEEQLRISNERISLANAELARAARLKDEFLAGMSHELRTPLNAILGLSEALLEEIFGALTDEQREHLTTIEQSGRHLLELINDILDLSKVESGKMELEIKSVSVQELCESSLSFVKQQAHHKRIKLEYRIDQGLTEIEVDERRIRQVLVNLLSNAVKFTPDGGNVQLQARADSFRETIELSVTDTGIGIAPENIGKLFQPFVQLDSALSRRYAGTGLGLALVRRIAELHGGSVTLESQEGKGSRFTVILPWNAVQAAQPSVEPETTPFQALNLQQALIVEDSEAAANQIARYLTELGAEPLIHPRGGEAVQIALRSHPTVIILDILLPDRSGWEVLAELKATPTTQAIPVIMISVVDERSRSLEMGAAAHLLKPFTRQQFQQTLSRVIAAPEPPEQQTALVPTATQALKLPLILIAEDNEANVVTLNSYLQAHDLEVILARNGLEAIQMAKQYQPDLILMDIQMPEMDGLEAIQRIRAEPNLQATPIIALTALAMPGDRERCLAVGATDYLTKPVNLKHMLRLLSQHIPQLPLQKGN
jgi:PAS domain S-box-containing protein